MRVQRYKKKTKDERQKPKISYICSKINVFMKKLPPYLGLFLIIIGTLVLISTRFAPFSSSNSILLSGLLLIVTGIVLHIRSIKHESYRP